MHKASLPDSTSGWLLELATAIVAFFAGYFFHKLVELALGANGMTVPD